jgi:hypothetical protein
MDDVASCEFETKPVQSEFQKNCLQRVCFGLIESAESKSEKHSVALLKSGRERGGV